MFSERSNPIVPRFRHIIFSEENPIRAKSRDVVISHGRTARCLLYDGCMAEGGCEGTPPIGMAEKVLPSWGEDFFLRIKSKSILNTAKRAMRCEVGKHMCIPDALMNAGNARTAGPMRKFRKNGPHSFRDAQNRLIQSGMNEWLSTSDISDIASAGAGCTFLAHYNDHAAGVVASASSLLIHDDRYYFAADIHTPKFVEIYESSLGCVSFPRLCVGRRDYEATKHPSFGLLSGGGDSLWPKSSIYEPIESLSSLVTGGTGNINAAVLGDILSDDVARNWSVLSGRSTYGAKTTGEIRFELCVTKFPQTCGG